MTEPLDSRGARAVGQRPLLRHIRMHRADEIGVSVIALHELYFSAHKGKRAAFNLARIDALQFELVLFDRNDASLAGVIRADLQARGIPIGAYDVLIAAQARSRDLILITHDSREFSRVPGLRWEDWEG